MGEPSANKDFPHFNFLSQKFSVTTITNCKVEKFLHTLKIESFQQKYPKIFRLLTFTYSFQSKMRKNSSQLEKFTKKIMYGQWCRYFPERFCDCIFRHVVLGETLSQRFQLFKFLGFFNTYLTFQKMPNLGIT